MIFVALGTQKFQLNRLLIEIDKAIEENKIQEPVFAQIGNSTYKPKNYPYCQFLSKEEYQDKILNCTVLITHSGVGTIIEGIRNHKKVIVYPRLEKYKEHVDNHQMEIGRSFQKRGFVILCNENDDLIDCIQKANKMILKEYVSSNAKIIRKIKGYIGQKNDKN